MDELKNFIEQNRSLFDDCEPMAGHEDRFLQKLQAAQPHDNRFNYRYLLKVAAVLVVSIIVGSHVAVNWVGHSTRLIESEVASAETDAASVIERTSRFVKAKTEPEYAQTQNYYINLVDNRLDEIRTAENLSEEQRAQLLKEMSEIDDLFASLQKELKANPDNPVLIDAMINHYQTKIDVLNQIISNLNSIKQLNTKQNESKVDL